MLLCPACGQQLIKHNYCDIQLDYCPGCGGLWFDDGEMESTVASLIRNDQVEDADIELHKAITKSRQIDEPLRNCPKCRVELTKFNYAYDSNVILDRCPSCKGVWADGNEINLVASCVKGNPKLDKMGAALADFHEEKKIVHDMAKQKGAAFSRTRAYPGPIFPIPIGIDNKTGKTPYILCGIMLINIVIFLFGLSVNEGLFHRYGFVPMDLFKLTAAPKMLSSMFIHADIAHLLGNMIFLWLFGVNIENRIGSKRFILLYLLCGVGAIVGHSVIYAGSLNPLGGASGAISGLMGAFYLLFPKTRINSLFMGRVIKVPAKWYLAGWMVLQLCNGIMSAFPTHFSNIAFWGHLSGFLTGYLILKLKKEEWSQS